VGRDGRARGPQPRAPVRSERSKRGPPVGSRGPGRPGLRGAWPSRVIQNKLAKHRRSGGFTMRARAVSHHLVPLLLALGLISAEVTAEPAAASEGLRELAAPALGSSRASFLSGVRVMTQNLYVGLDVFP